MKRVVILGRGASGKSTLARRLGDIAGLPVIELDKIFWRPGLIATPREEWVAVQDKLVAGDRWIMDGDLGPYDAFEVRLRAADTIIVLDFSQVRCAWRAIRRSRERADFWRWLLAYRYQGRPILRAAIANHAPSAVLYVFRSPKALGRFVADRCYASCPVNALIVQVEDAPNEIGFFRPSNQDLNGVKRSDSGTVLALRDRRNVALTETGRTRALRSPSSAPSPA